MSRKDIVIFRKTGGAGNASVAERKNTHTRRNRLLQEENPSFNTKSINLKSSFMTKTISKSGKKRSAGVKFHGREGGGSRLEKRGLQRDWQQVVEITEVRNRLGIV